MNNILKRSLLFLIALYQSVSYLLGGKHCRFSPSCSQYAIDAINKYGSLRGVIKIGKRLLRCHPFSRGGYDPA